MLISNPFIATLFSVLALMAGAWILSLVKKKACVADSFWGAGFVLVAWTTWLMGPGTSRSLLIAVLISIWGGRLAYHITRRNWGKPEDRRYQAMRDHHGKNFWWKSLFSVFLLQAVLLWLISIAPQAAQLSAHPDVLTLLDGIGVLIWTVGMMFEATADRQMEKFRKDPANKAKVMEKGLWAWSRHPNYFGESLVWWGFFCIALAVPGGWLTIFSPLIITFLLLKVSGVAMLEKEIGSRRPGYEEYQKRVNAFFPWFQSSK